MFAVLAGDQQTFKDDKKAEDRSKVGPYQQNSFVHPPRCGGCHSTVIFHFH